MTRTSRVACVALGVYVASGCAVESRSIEAVANMGDEDACVGAACPGNSDLFAALGIFELSLNPNDVSARGFSIDTDPNGELAVWKDGHQLTDFRVDGVWPYAYDEIEDHPVMLTGFRDVAIRIKHKSGVKFDLRVVDSLTTGYYTMPLPSGLTYFYAYKIEYRPSVGPVPGGGPTPGGPGPTNDDWEDLCPYKDMIDHNLAATWAVFWRGDRIDPVTGMLTASNVKIGNVEVDRVGSWFNISCAGEATIKMLRTGTGGAVDLTTTPLQRQATLDMFTARYCPDSYERYTHLGQAIDWDDKTGSNTLPAAPQWVNYEAIWNGHGAVCLDHPRIPFWPERYACVPPPCTGDKLHNWASIGWLRSGKLKPKLVILPAP